MALFREAARWCHAGDRQVLFAEQDAHQTTLTHVRVMDRLVATRQGPRNQRRLWLRSTLVGGR